MNIIYGKGVRIKVGVVLLFTAAAGAEAPTARGIWAFAVCIIIKIIVTASVRGVRLVREGRIETEGLDRTFYENSLKEKS